MSAGAVPDKFKRYAFWATGLVVLVLSLLPVVPAEIPTTGWDKSNHMLAFVVLALLGRLAYRRNWRGVLVGLVAFGGLIEVLQSFTPTREAEWADLFADSLGISLVGLVGPVLDWRPLRRSSGFVLGLPRAAKRVVALAADASLCVLTVWMALSLRLDTWVHLSAMHWVAVLGSLVLALPLFVTFGLYRAIFRYGGNAAVAAMWQACLIYALLYAVAFTVIGIDGVPRTIGLLQPPLLLVAITASRAVARYWLGGAYQGQIARNTLPAALIYGAGSAGQQLAEAMRQSPDMHVVGFLDDDRRLQGGMVQGLTVHSPRFLAERVRTLKVSTVLLAMPSAPRKRRNQILATALDAQVAVRTLPGLADMAHGRVQTSDLRELDIDDLLGRDPVPPNHILLGKNIRGKVVLVTGAGGSIGSELCRQIVKLAPDVLLLVERSEFALYSIDGELRELLARQPATAVRVMPLLASVGEASRMREIMETWRPNTVYHAAAYKHVPLVEHNAAEGVKNNVYGTLVTARAAIDAGVNDFVLVSTDKAVRPTNVMGTSKRVAEMVLQALAQRTSRAAGSTRFCMVRFGNVLGSSGSVVPLFRRQIAEGGPITLTHPGITRFFMTIPEAAQLVIQAGAMAHGGDVFVLDMGDPVKIVDLARRMVELSGRTVADTANPDGDIAIRITGLRPGEKLYEELLIGDNPLPTNHSRIMKAHEDFLAWDELEERLKALEVAMNVNDVPQIRVLLKQMVDGYRPDGDVVDWVHVAQRDATKVA
ncbi:VanZ family protein [Variovorax sp. dw_308]|uniref:VanZ family protein n=1 Tax=Variovorax sp. dw_308 TaxID=2721546 RepID=UPI001C44CFAB|nr:VanZ family protein [Variovorax sp. dw_308]